MSLLLAQHSQRSSVVTFWSHPVYMSAVVVAASAGGGVTAQVLRTGVDWGSMPSKAGWCQQRHNGDSCSWGWLLCARGSAGVARLLGKW
jgi:hypothetical protein